LTLLWRKRHSAGLATFFAASATTAAFWVAFRFAYCVLSFANGNVENLLGKLDGVAGTFGHESSMPHETVGLPRVPCGSKFKLRHYPRFLSFARRQAGGTPQIQSVVKIDPRGLVCQQFLITLDQANAYVNNIRAESWSVDHCLTIDTALAGINFAEVPNGWNFNLPHGEFMFAFNGQVFGVTECAPYVSVSFIKGRTVLWTGYHRCYARAANADPAMMDSSVLAVVTTKGDEALAGNQPLRNQLLGDRPPVLGDFLDERLCLEVEVRRKRYQLQVRAEVAQINAD
jgi:hypothetical protein